MKTYLHRIECNQASTSFRYGKLKAETILIRPSQIPHQDLVEELLHAFETSSELLQMLLSFTWSWVCIPRVTDQAFTGVQVESVVGGCAGQPGSLSLSGGRTVGARRAIVVATDAPAARQLLGSALEASPSKTEPGVGTCNVYFRWGLSRPQIFFSVSCEL